MPVISSGKQRLVVDPEGQVWGQGTNASNQLGLTSGAQGLYFHRPEIITDLPPIVSVEAGYQHSMFLDQNGQVWALGYNEENFLGEGGWTISSPRIITGLPRIKSFSAGFRHTLFLDYEGRLWGFGSNRDGRIGADAQLRSSVITEPIQIMHETPIAQISAGSTYSFILDNDGNVWATGSGEFNEHGLMPDEFFEEEDVGGEEIMVPEFTPVPNLPPMSKILAGNAHSIGLTFDGQVVIFGLLSGGEENYDDIILRPTIIPDLPSIDDISIGSEHNLALTEGGEVYIISMLITSDDQTMPLVNKLESSNQYKEMAGNLSDLHGEVNLLVDQDNRVWQLDIRSNYLYEDEGEREARGPFTAISPFFDLISKDPDASVEPKEKEPLLSYDLIDGLFEQEKVRDYRIREQFGDIFLIEFELTDDSLYLGYVNYDPEEDRIYLSEERQSETSYFGHLTDIVKLWNKFPEHEFLPDFYSDERGNQAFRFVDPNDDQSYITLVSVENGTIYPPN